MGWWRARRLTRSVLGRAGGSGPRRRLLIIRPPVVIPRPRRPTLAGPSLEDRPLLRLRRRRLSYATCGRVTVLVHFSRKHYLAPQKTSSSFFNIYVFVFVFQCHLCLSLSYQYCHQVNFEKQIYKYRCIPHSLLVYFCHGCLQSTSLIVVPNSNTHQPIFIFTSHYPNPVFPI